MNNTDRTIHVVTLLCVQQNHLLVVRKHGSKLWMLPGGKPDGQETATSTLVRELDEELGVGVADLAWFGRFSAAAANELGCRVEAQVYRGALRGVPQVSAEIAELSWLDLDQLDPATLAPLLREQILPALATSPREGVLLLQEQCA